MSTRIADKINESLATITYWTADWELPYLGLTFKKLEPSILDTLITNAKNDGNWLNVARFKRMAELIGYASPTIDDATKAFLSSVPMFTSAPIPINESPSWFRPSLGVVMNGYRWARELNHELTRWNWSNAIVKLQGLRYPQPYPFYRCNVDTGEVNRLNPTGEWHESAELSHCFLLLAILGRPPPEEPPEIKPLPAYAEMMALWEWNELNRIYWAGDHYNYSPSLPNWENSAPSVFFYIAKLHVTFDRKWGEYHRVVTDTEKRYLTTGWGSPQWGGYHVPVSQNPSDLKRVLDYYLPGMGLLHMVYPKMSNVGKASFRGMLTGQIAPRMADGLLASDLYSAGRFRMQSDLPLSDTATAYGCATLFLQAIVPNTGSLAVPVYMEGMDQRECTFFDAHHFGFDYDARQIKVPVYAGKLQFYFGDTPVEYTFPYDGIYTVTFTSDWNQISSAYWTASLDKVYLEAPTPPPTQLTALAQLTLASTTLLPFLVATAKEIKKHVTS